jgi:type II secretory pathway pseudopilin PulG
MRKGEKGFTLIEVTIIVLVLVILGAILTPVVETYIEKARIARVREDLGLIASAIEMFKVDMCHSWFLQDVGGANTYAYTNRVDLLISDGDIPGTPAGGNGLDWNSVKNTSPQNANFATDTMYNQLVIGTPYNSGNTSYPRSSGSVTGNLLSCGFRGPYLPSPVLADPWGFRYMANVAFLQPAGGTWDSAFAKGIGGTGTVTSNAGWNAQPVYVLSAGPDGYVSTPFANASPATGALGYTVQGDDQAAMIKGSF